jgi:hypothetical protein
MKLSEIKQPINEIDLSSFIGDRGAAAVRSGLGSLVGRSSGQMSTQEKMAYDTYIKSFVGNYANEINQAVKSGLVAPQQPEKTPPVANKTAPTSGSTTQQPGKTPPVANKTAPTSGSTTQQPGKTPPVANKTAPTSGSATPKPYNTQATQPSTGVGPKPAGQYTPNPELDKIRQQKQALATQAAQAQMKPAPQKPGTTAFNQMATQLTTPKAPGQQAFGNMASQLAKTGATDKIAQTRQRKQSNAAKAVQKQMVPVSKLPQNQFATAASNVRKQKQASAIQAINSPVKQKKLKKSVSNPLVSESMLNEQMSISQFVYNKISNGLKNTQNVQQYLPGFQKLANDIEQAYVNAGGGIAGDRAIKGPLTQLAQQSYIILKSEPQTSGKDQQISVKGQQGQTSQLSPFDQLKELVSKFDKRQKLSLLKDLDPKAVAPQASIGGQKLDPNDPASAKILAKMKAQRSKKAV